MMRESQETPAQNTCACCGYRPLKSPRLKDGVVLGPVCINHYPEKRCRGKSTPANQRELGEFLSVGESQDVLEAA